MSKIPQVELWLSIVSQIHYETNGFAQDVLTLPDHKLFQLKPIDEWVIEFAPKMLAVIHHKDKARFRNCIVYLTALRQKQGKAWERQSAQFENENEELKLAIAELQERINGKENGRHRQHTA